jgi:hypothetical protein
MRRLIIPRVTPVVSRAPASIQEESWHLAILNPAVFKDNPWRRYLSMLIESGSFIDACRFRRDLSDRISVQRRPLDLTRDPLIC